jgi:hypothetical protein
MFKLGVACSLGTMGAYNAIVGSMAVVQGVMDSSAEYLGIGGLALAVGVVQVVAASKIVARNPQPRADDDFTHEQTRILGGGIGGAGSFYPGLKIGVLVASQAAVQNLPKIARVAVGVLVQTGSGILIGGVATIAATLFLRGGVCLYRAAQEARMRRNNPDMAAPLVDGANGVVLG